jgi:hypothetical protein
MGLTHRHWRVGQVQQAKAAGHRVERVIVIRQRLGRLPPRTRLFETTMAHAAALRRSECGFAPTSLVISAHPKSDLSGNEDSAQDLDGETPMDAEFES